MDNDPEPVENQKKEKSLNELLTSTVVDIYVGPDSTHWPLHERLLCYHSPFLANVFYNDYDKSRDKTDNKNKSSSRKSYGLPDEENETFTLLVGWLYSRVVPPPKTEKDIGPLLDLYLLAQKLEMDALSSDVVDATREFYHTSSTYPGLRRVQYIYGNTDEDNEMREMMVSSVARQLATTEKVPIHWANALQRNGQLAVDIIRAIQRWHIEENSIPDIRDGSISRSRGRKGKGGFSAVTRDGESVETETTGAMTGSVSLGSNLGVESVASDELGADQDKTGEQGDKDHLHESRLVIEGEAPSYYYLSLVQTQRRTSQSLMSEPPSSSSYPSPLPTTSSSLTSPTLDFPNETLRDPDKYVQETLKEEKFSINQEQGSGPRLRRRRPSVTFSDEVDFLPPELSSSPSPSPSPSLTPTPPSHTQPQPQSAATSDQKNSRPKEKVDQDTVVTTNTNTNTHNQESPPPVLFPVSSKDVTHGSPIQTQTQTQTSEPQKIKYRYEIILLSILWTIYLWGVWEWYFH